MRVRSVAFAVLLALAQPVAAHRLAPSLLSVAEGGDGRFEAHFKKSRQQASGVEIEAVLPERCAASEPRAAADASSVTWSWSLDCGSEGLVGAQFGVRGLAESGTNALVRVALADGRRIQAVLHGDAPRFRVPARDSAREVFSGYLRLGAQHIASGADHLLFVFGLLLLVTGGRALLATVTAFTLGHSVTLSLASLGFVRFPAGPIELLIAATIVVLALELARRPRREDSLLRRRPWSAALGFGLLHGLGFAGALAELGLPQQEIPLALLAFNLGIELGQLGFVALVLLAGAALRPLLAPAPGWLRELPVTAMGGLAVYWCLDRATGLF